MLAYRLGSAVLIFICLVFFSLLPYCGLSIGARSKRGAFVLSLCNCVACGIFLSTCFLGLIPHVQMQEKALRDAYSTAQSLYAAQSNGNSNASHPGSGGLPIAFLNTQLIVLVGFVLILLLEQTIMACSSKETHTHAVLGGGSSPGEDQHRMEIIKRGRREAEEREALVAGIDSDEDDLDMEEIVFRKEGSAESEVTRCPEAARGHGHSHEVSLNNGLSLRTFFLLLGLSIHSVFEGLALGLQSDPIDFAHLLFAIMLHEVLCCLAYGISLAQQRAPMAAAVSSVCILSACIPVGMLAAMLVDSIDGSSALTIRFLLEGIAAGTFVYVACVEMLSMELANLHGKQGVAGAFSVGLGVLIFAVLRNTVDQQHEGLKADHSGL